MLVSNQQTGLSYFESSPPPGQKFYYKIDSHNSAGAGPFSPEISWKIFEASSAFANGLVAETYVNPSSSLTGPATVPTLHTRSGDHTRWTV